MLFSSGLCKRIILSSYIGSHAMNILRRLSYEAGLRTSGRTVIDGS